MRRHPRYRAGREEHLRSLKGPDRITNKPAAQPGKEVNRRDEVEKSWTNLVRRKVAPLAVEVWVNGSPLTDDDLEGEETGTQPGFR
jgi:hypothetical protein